MTGYRKLSKGGRSFFWSQYGNALYMHETPIEDGSRHVFEAVLGDLHAASYGRPGTGEFSKQNFIYFVHSIFKDFSENSSLPKSPNIRKISLRIWILSRTFSEFRATRLSRYSFAISGAVLPLLSLDCKSASSLACSISRTA